MSKHKTVDLTCCIYRRCCRLQQYDGKTIRVAKLYCVWGQFIYLSAELLKDQVKRHTQVDQVVEIVATLERDTVRGQVCFEHLFNILLCVETNGFWRWVGHREQITSDAQVVLCPDEPFLSELTDRVLHRAPCLRVPQYA